MSSANRRCGMDVGALSYGSSLTRISQTGRSGASDVAPKATDAKEQAAGASPAQSPGLYISPVLRYDQSARVAVLLFRDFDTGETRDQIPAERVVEQYRRTGGPPQSAGEQRSTEAVERVLLGERSAGGAGGAESSSGGYSSGGGSTVATTGLGASL
ncbi:MAG TPA: hypothetical protein PKZ97_18255, partial [Azospirillaceae bacterium]|nr:hypothetical protein [Azospirillaceae bacterium]